MKRSAAACPPAAASSSWISCARPCASRAPDADNREFQRQVGHFVLGMTLEIGHTFQDEFDLPRSDKEKIDRLIARLEDAAPPGDDSLDAALFHADLSRKGTAPHPHAGPEMEGRRRRSLSLR